MALIRIYGGGSGAGLRDYLIHGQKSGREFSRDELDHRVKLTSDDLDTVAQLIDSLEPDRENFLHITLSFKEKGLSADFKREIVEEFRQWAFTAYRPDEYMLYAEAHEPRIESYVESSSGEEIERFDHIHIVIPDVNLVSGNRLDLFGSVQQQIKFIDAFQEHINNKYGLASPKDNPRFRTNLQSEIIGRNKSTKFDGGVVEVPKRALVLERIGKAVIERRIENYADFEKLLGEFGEVSIGTRPHDTERDANGKPTREKYFKVLINGEKRPYRLDDAVFRRAFIELPTDEKIQRQEATATREYIERTQARKNPEYVEQAMREWHEIRARELRYINSGNRTFYERYKGLSRADKLAVLDQQEAAWNAKHRPENQHEREHGTDGTRHDRGIYYGHSPEPADEQGADVNDFDPADRVLTVLSERRLATGRAREEAASVLQAAEVDHRPGPGRLRRESVRVTLDGASHAGVLVAHGEAPYKGDKSASMSYFVTYAGAGGRERTVWGVDLKRAIAELEPAIGESIALVNTGRTEVEVRVPVLGDDGQETGQIRIEKVRRNEWLAGTLQETAQSASGDVSAQSAEVDEAAARKAAQEAEKLADRRAKGEAILENPEQVIAHLTRTQSVFSRSELERHLKRHTADAEQFRQAFDAVMAAQELVGLVGEDRGNRRDGRIVGHLLEHGIARYEHRPDGSPSYFVKYLDADGQEKTVWGVGLKQAMRELDPAIGDRISLTNEGRQAITLAEPVRDESGQILRWEQKEAYRNVWKAQQAPLHASGQLFTSREVRAIETRLIERIERMAENVEAAVSDRSRAAAAGKRTFNEGQREAFEAMTGGEQIVIVNGAAGTGKSYSLAAMREAFEADGYKVYGAILQGKTADDLQRDSGIDSRTIHRMLSDLAKGEIAFDSKTVLVIDEAGMVGSRQMEALMGYVEQAGAKIRLVGDAKQLHAVEYGNAFEHVSRRVGVHNLTQIMRQRHDWMIEASTAASNHDIGTSVRAYAAHDTIHQVKTQDDAKAQLVERWNDERLTTAQARSRVVLVATNDERNELNAMMREKMRESGHLGDEAQVNGASGKLALAAGDQIMFLKNEYRELDVRNGTAATVEKVNGHIVTARLQDGRTVDVDTQKYSHLDYGYAMTIHKSQGITVDSAHVLLSSNMTAELYYVASTRHKDSLTTFYSQEQFKDLDAVIRRVSTPDRKEFSAEYEATRESTPGQLIEQLHERKARDADAERAEFAGIRANLDAEKLLAWLSHTHGKIVADYSVEKHADGHDVIRCGSRRLNVRDFLTDECRLSWDKAKPILRECYEAQRAGVDIMTRSNPNQIMFKEFNVWKHHDMPAERAQAWKEHLHSVTERQRAIVADYNAERDRLKQLKAQPGGFDDYKTELGLAKGRRAFRETELRASIEAEQTVLTGRYDIRTGDLYRQWLGRQAGQGNDRALAELRQQTLRDAGAASDHRNSLSGQELTGASRVAAPMLRNMKYETNRYGDVTYKLDGEQILVDEYRRVRYASTDDTAIETGLRLSVQKFGSVIAVNGDEEFKRRVVEVSIDRGLRIQFSNPELAQYATEYSARRPQSMTERAEAALREPVEPATPGARNEGEGLDGAALDALRQQAEREAREIQRREQETAQRDAQQEQAPEHRPTRRPGLKH